MLDFTATPNALRDDVPVLTDEMVIAAKAREGLRKVASGEDQTMTGWLEYGAALNEGRRLFASNNKFHVWMLSNQLGGTHDLDRAAAMWSASDEPAFWSFQRLHPRVRTVRGLHAKWKEARCPKPKEAAVYEEPTEAERETVRKLRAIYEDPAADQHFKENVKRKLDTYEARFGDISKPETGHALSTKKELAHAITQLAVKKAAKNEKAFSILEFAINHLYGSEEQMARVLNQLKKL